MTSDEVANIVRSQIGDNWDVRNSHGVDIVRCLVRPVEVDIVFRRVRSGEVSDELLRVWLVLEERVVERDGYKIVFDEGSRSFGLAVAMEDSLPMFLGIYGSFIDALEGM
jgi:hypothetical protein